MTGFTDAFLEETSAKLRENLLSHPKPYYRPGGLIPDVWVEPMLVWEVIAAGMSLSPVAQVGRSLFLLASLLLSIS
jgi:DNA ligase 1